MSYEAEFLLLDIYCDNCGQQLAGRWGPAIHGMVIAGAEPVEFRHANGSTECPPLLRKARAYSCWVAAKAMREATTIAKAIGKTGEN